MCVSTLLRARIYDVGPASAPRVRDFNGGGLFIIEDCPLLTCLVSRVVYIAFFPYVLNYMRIARRLGVSQYDGSYRVTCYVVLNLATCLRFRSFATMEAPCMSFLLTDCVGPRLSAFATPRFVLATMDIV